MYRFNANIEIVQAGTHTGKFAVVSMQTGNRIGLFDTHAQALAYMTG